MVVHVPWLCLAGIHPPDWRKKGGREPLPELKQIEGLDGKERLTHVELAAEEDNALRHFHNLVRGSLFLIADRRLIVQRLRR